MSPTVSIITPTGNREPFLPAIYRCIQSQRVDWEWLVCDDSPQPSAFLSVLSKTDARVRYHWSKTRMSIGAKRNFLVNESRGARIAHFDDDDHYTPDYLSGMVRMLDENGADLVKLSTFWMYAPHTQFFGYMDLNARVGLHYVLTGNSVGTVEFHDGMKIGADFILFYGFSYVYRKALFEVARFDEIDLSEDESFIRRVVAAGRTALAADDRQASCLHLIHPASTSRCFSRYSMPAFTLPKVFPGYEGYPLEVGAAVQD
jgi:glycosyltransferase involved in cell wall biosynthesis